MKEQRKASAQGGGGSPVYGLGFIGAVAWFWPQAHDPKERALAVLKAMVWPAFLVHGAFKALEQRGPAEPSGSDAAAATSAMP
jgi:hypothetical protein